MASFDLTGVIVARKENDDTTFGRPEWVIEWDDPGIKGSLGKHVKYSYITINLMHFPKNTQIGDKVVYKNTGGTKTIYHFNGPPTETPLKKNLNTINNGPDGKMWIVVQPFPRSKCRWELVSDQQQDCKMHDAKRLKIHHDSSEIPDKIIPKDDMLKLSRQFWNGIHEMFNN